MWTPDVHTCRISRDKNHEVRMHGHTSEESASQLGRFAAGTKSRPRILWTKCQGWAMYTYCIHVHAHGCNVHSFRGNEVGEKTSKGFSSGTPGAIVFGENAKCRKRCQTSFFIYHYYLPSQTFPKDFRREAESRCDNHAGTAVAALSRGSVPLFLLEGFQNIVLIRSYSVL